MVGEEWEGEGLVFKNQIVTYYSYGPTAQLKNKTIEPISLLFYPNNNN